MRQARSCSSRIDETGSVAFSFPTDACRTHLGELVVVVTKLWLDGTAVYAKLVQDLSDLIGDRHVVDIPADHDVNRSDDRSFGQLPDVKLETPYGIVSQRRHQGRIDQDVGLTSWRDTTP